MLKEFIDRIVELGAPTIVDIGGLPYVDRNLQPVMDPLIGSVGVVTLQGFVDAINARLNGVLSKDCVVHIQDFKTVRLLALNPDRFGRRVVHLEASAMGFPDSAFAFGRYCDHETFIIALQARFAATEEQQGLLRLVSTLTSEHVGVTDDNGIYQVATIKKGVALKENVVIRPRVTLKPYRTFHEADQPASDFIFRVQSNGPDQKPQCGLFEADGGRWKSMAMYNIAQWLADRVDALLPIIA